MEEGESGVRRKEEAREGCAQRPRFQDDVHRLWSQEWRLQVGKHLIALRLTALARSGRQLRSVARTFAICLVASRRADHVIAPPKLTQSFDSIPAFAAIAAGPSTAEAHAWRVATTSSPLAAAFAMQRSR